MVTMTSILIIPLIVIGILVFKIIKSGIISVAKLIFKTEIFLVCFIGIALFLSQVLPFSLFILSPLLILISHVSVPLGIMGFLTVVVVLINNFDYKKVYLVLILVLSLLLIILGSSQYKSEVQYLTASQKRADQGKIRFNEISERFNQPQKVIRMDRARFILEGGVSVDLNGINPEAYQKNPNIEEDINKFGNENIVGNYITIVLPDQILCGPPEPIEYSDCFAEHDNTQSPVMYGKIYFNGESLDEKFQLIPTE